MAIFDFAITIVTIVGLIVAIAVATIIYRVVKNAQNGCCRRDKDK